MRHIELPIGAFLAAILVLIPLPWHWRARNIATLSLIAWLFISNLIFGINSIIWMGRVVDVAPVWCDIVTKLQVGSNISLPACCLCLCIHLERIASARHTSNNLEDKRRRMLLDATLCWGIPIIYMALHYVVQGHRFDIVENFGCRPALFNSVQAILLIWLPPLVVTVLTILYASLALHHFFVRRITFGQHLQNNSSALTSSRYFRLIAMAVVQMFWCGFIISFNVWYACYQGLRKWISWKDVHSNFGRVAQFPFVMIPPLALRIAFLMWWAIPASSVLFFIFFAFGHDAMKEHKQLFGALRKLITRHITRQGLKPESQSKAIKPASTKRFKLPFFRSCPLCGSPKTPTSDDTVSNTDVNDTGIKPTSPQSTMTFDTDSSGGTILPSPHDYDHKEDIA